jgi:ketosteroid isomerase-like protein
MKKLILFLSAIALITMYSCKDSATTEAAETEEATEVSESAEAPDYDLFNSRVAILKEFFQAHENEDMEAISNLLSDTIKVSPPSYNGNQMVGKEEFLAALKNYHDNFDNIKYTEGLVLGDTPEVGWWSGSVYPAENASYSAQAIRIYGTWKATHTESGKEIGVKYYAIGWINDDGKISQFTAYYDAHGIDAQLAE